MSLAQEDRLEGDFEQENTPGVVRAVPWQTSRQIQRKQKERGFKTVVAENTTSERQWRGERREMYRANDSAVYMWIYECAVIEAESIVYPYILIMKLTKEPEVRPM